jgi:hypothetical protein
MNRFELMYAADYLRTEVGITTRAAMMFRNWAGTDSELINCKNSTSFLPRKLHRLAKSKYGSRSTFEDFWTDESLKLNRKLLPHSSGRRGPLASFDYCKKGNLNS